MFTVSSIPHLAAAITVDPWSSNRYRNKKTLVSGIDIPCDEKYLAAKIAEHRK